MNNSDKKMSMRKVLATSALLVGGLTILGTGVGMASVSADNTTPSTSTSTTASTTTSGTTNQKQGRPQLTDEQKAALTALREKAVASLSAEDQATYTALQAKGHFALTFAEHDQLDAIETKIRAYMDANPSADLPTPPANGGQKGDKQGLGATLTDAQKTELDTLKAEGIASLTAEEQARLKELDTKDRMTKTDAEKQEMHALMDKVMTYVQSKVSFEMPTPPQKGGRGGDRGQAATDATTSTSSSTSTSATTV